MSSINSFIERSGGKWNAKCAIDYEISIINRHITYVSNEFETIIERSRRVSNNLSNMVKARRNRITDRLKSDRQDMLSLKNKIENATVKN